MKYDPVAVMSKAREREDVAMALRHAGLTYEEIGRRFGVTRERARQIVAKGERIRRFKQLDLTRQPGGFWA